MRILVQRVKEASVEVDKKIVGSIEDGLLVFLGIHKDDDADQTGYLVNKLLNLRIFQDDKGKMNLSVKDKGGEILVISQFTLYGNCNKGNRPDFMQTKEPRIAEKIYDKFAREIKQSIGAVQTGTFGAYMQVSLINDGPVTFMIDDRKEVK